MRLYDKLTQDDIQILAKSTAEEIKNSVDTIYHGSLIELLNRFEEIISLTSAGNIENSKNPQVQINIKNIARIIDVLKDYGFIFSMENYFRLSSLFLLGKNFEQYFFCRNCAREILIAQTPSPDWDMDMNMLYIAALAEEIDTHGNVIMGFYKNLDEDTKKTLRPQIRVVNFLQNGAASYCKASAAVTKSEADQAFAAFVKNKRIAMVGPVDVGLKSGAEIDSYDLVIRFNHTSRSVYDDDAFGRRTDISYYTNPAFKKLVFAHDDRLQGLAYAIPQNMADKYITINPDDYACKMRPQYRRSNNIFFKSYGNAIQRLLLDLMRFEIQELKVFNMDLWLTAHNNNYLARRASLDPHTFIHHDPVTNFHFLKNAYTKKIIHTDTALEKILSASVTDYVCALQKAHGLAV